MKKNKIEAVDKTSYYSAFNKWLNASTEFFDLKNEILMNEKWLKFAGDLGLVLGSYDLNGNLLVEVEDNVCWKEAKKYYSIISFRAELKEQEV
jgi:hypothetical protein